jgi:hypothetical protein
MNDPIAPDPELDQVPLKASSGHLGHVMMMMLLLLQNTSSAQRQGEAPQMLDQEP